MTIKYNNLFLDDLVPNATICGSVEIFENVFPNCEETIKLVEQECSNPNSGVYWTRAETMGQGAFQNARTNKLLPVTYLAEVADSKILQNIHNQFYTLLLSAGIGHLQRFEIGEEIFHEGYNLLKYSEGEQYRAHYDGGTGVGRAISAVCYLNSDFEGGELEFVNFGVKVKPQPGMLILFPSNYTYRHIAHPVISGTKYNLVTWIRDRQF